MTPLYTYLLRINGQVYPTKPTSSTKSLYLQAYALADEHNASHLKAQIKADIDGVVDATKFHQQVNKATAKEQAAFKKLLDKEAAAKQAKLTRKQNQIASRVPDLDPNQELDTALVKKLISQDIKSAFKATRRYLDEAAAKATPPLSKDYIYMKAYKLHRLVLLAQKKGTQ